MLAKGSSVCAVFWRLPGIAAMSYVPVASSVMCCDADFLYYAHICHVYCACEPNIVSMNIC